MVLVVASYLAASLSPPMTTTTRLPYDSPSRLRSAGLYVADSPCDVFAIVCMSLWVVSNQMSTLALEMMERERQKKEETLRIIKGASVDVDKAIKASREVCVCAYTFKNS